MVKLILSFFIFITLTNAQSDLSNRIQKIISSLPSSTKASGYIIDANTGEEIFSKDIEKSMIPASNTKLFTTGAALYLMGPKHEFTTKILTNNPEIKDGILDGDLFIKGFGHSTFGYKDFDSLISLFIKSDVKVITGNIIGDDYYFDNLYTRDDWIIDERANVKLPPVSALVINRNQLVITLNASGNERSKLRYSIKPDFSFINVDMNAVVTRNRSYPRISTSFNKNQLNIKVNNGLRKRRTPLRYAVNIENPPLFFALALKESLEKRGIKVLGKAEVGETPNSIMEMASVGIALDSLISIINKTSNNYLAECLFKSLGAFYSGEEGNSFYATQAVLSAFDDVNIIDDETVVVDGSGISRFNTMTTGSVVRLLYDMYKHKLFYEYFYRSLAISGIDGTLKDRRVSNFIQGNFHGKTGTLNGVTSLSGYITGTNNHLYIVSIIMEYKSKGSSFHKGIEDEILLELTK